MCHTDEAMEIQKCQNQAKLALYQGLVRLENDFAAVANGTSVTKHELETLVNRAEDYGILRRDSIAGEGLMRGEGAETLQSMTLSTLRRLEQDPFIREFMQASP